MNKRELVCRVAKETGIPQIIVKSCLDSILKVALAALDEGERISFQHFGSFYTKTYKEKHMRNPQSGIPYTTPPRRAIRFKSTSDKSLTIEKQG